MSSRPAGLASTLVAAARMAWCAHRPAFAGQVAVAALAGLAPVAAAWMLREVIDLLVSGHQRGRLLVVIVVLAVVGGIQSIAPNITQYLSAQTSRATQLITTRELFRAVNRQEGLRRLEDPAYHDRLNVAQQTGNSAPARIVANGISVVQGMLAFAGFVITLALLSPVIAGVVVLAAVPGIFSELGVSRRRTAMITGLSHAQRRQYFYANLLTEYAAAKEIRLFGLGAFFGTRMLDELRSIQRASQRVDRRELAVYTGLAAISALVATGGLLWVVLAAAAGRLTAGDVSVFVIAMASVTSTLTVLIANTSMAYQGLLMFRTYRAVVAESPDLATVDRPARATAMRRGLELEDVWFRYSPDAPWVLRGVDLSVPQGRTVAVVGHNGAGKSTLVKLMCRFYDPDRGRILWDGTDLRDLDVASLRDRISVVFQDFMSYELSVADNIAVGDLTQAADGKALVAAARQAGIHDTLAGLPSGYSTMLTRSYYDQSDRDDPRTGVLVSGGQWQRIGLARALLRTRRDLLILDEPSSGLDAEAEHEIYRALRQERGHHATVLISHRLNTVRDADHIVVLADGVLGEEGTHDALMARSGIYARLFSLQASGYAIPVAGSAGGADA